MFSNVVLISRKAQTEYFSFRKKVLSLAYFDFALAVTIMLQGHFTLYTSCVPSNELRPATKVVVFVNTLYIKI